ncbi:MAG TPA: hypothetical protein VLJ58_21605 [Ramlibacter sp.]|nr:hypothetical protein [Ramlibacter sp.]
MQEVAVLAVVERPILMSAPMVRATLRAENPKTQTRRVVKPRDLAWMDEHQGLREPCNAERCPYGRPVDQLWVREAWAYNPDFPGIASRACFRADPEHKHDGLKWKPSIHMPHAVSRIQLEVTDVRVERLQDINETDAAAEGITCDSDGWTDYSMPSTQCCWSPKDSYRTLWESINGPGSWDLNPWVWVIAFRRIKP